MVKPNQYKASTDLSHQDFIDTGFTQASIWNHTPFLLATIASINKGSTAVEEVEPTLNELANDQRSSLPSTLSGP